MTRTYSARQKHVKNGTHQVLNIFQIKTMFKYSDFTY